MSVHPAPSNPRAFAYLSTVGVLPPTKRIDNASDREPRPLPPDAPHRPRTSDGVVCRTGALRRQLLLGQ